MFHILTKFIHVRTDHKSDPNTLSSPPNRRPAEQTPANLSNDTTKDTDSTPERCFVGALENGHMENITWYTSIGFHSSKVAAGSFDVHDVEAAEAYHKHCMKLPSLRVKHWTDQNKTHHDMQKFLLRDLLFRALKKEITPFATLQRRKTFGVTKTLTGVVMGADLAAVDVQGSILHPEVRLARVEILDLLCFKFNVPGCRTSYTLLGGLQWDFGQKYTNSDGQVYWSTDSQYGYSSSGHRRDSLLLHGSVDTEIRLADGQIVERQTALCCQAVCFVTLTGMQTVLHLPLPKDIKKEITDDSLTLVLVRWFEAHPTATM